MDGSTMAGFEPAAEHPESTPKGQSRGWKVEQGSLAEAIETLAADGRSAAEIGKSLGIPRARVLRIAKRKGIELAGAAGRRSVCVELPAAHAERIAALAAVAKVTRAEMIARMVAAALEEDDARVRRNLGKRALPKRRYRPRAKKSRS